MESAPVTSGRIAGQADGLVGSKRPEPHLFRFGLRQLLGLATIVTLLAGAMAATPGAWPLVIGSTAALIAAHVFGTVVGARLRDTSQAVEHWRESQGGAAPEGPRRAFSSGVSRVAAPPLPTTLAQRHEAPHRDRRALTVGAAIGFVLGTLGIFLAWGARLGLPAVLIGAVSTAVLGAWIAWIGTSFAAISRTAWQDANADHARDVERKRAAARQRQAASSTPSA
ncbi:MAG: hypothetical protein KF847_11610 [Pirellulales bacterium]|nr:hypothetical protein [Pirellulales bacterium]